MPKLKRITCPDPYGYSLNQHSPNSSAKLHNEYECINNKVDLNTNGRCFIHVLPAALSYLDSFYLAQFVFTVHIRVQKKNQEDGLGEHRPVGKKGVEITRTINKRLS